MFALYPLAAAAAMAMPVAAGDRAAAPASQVVITGRRASDTAPGIEAARAEAARVPGGANVVGNDEYADGRASTLADVFSMTPGVFVQTRFGAEEARLSIRGSGLQRTFHMRGINLLQDGVPITLADGSGDFQAIEPLALSYTEVLRGANALQFGATTLGGAVNFISPSGHDASGLRPRLEAGSFGYRRALLGVGDVAGPVDYFVSASGYSQDGFRDWSGQSNARLFGNVGLRISDTLETRFFLAAVHTDSQLPGSLTKAQLASTPDRANPGSLAGRQKRDFDLYRLANRTVLDFGERSLELSAGYSYKDLWHPIFQVLQQRSNDYNIGLRYIDTRSLAGRENRFIFGIAPTWNEVQDDRFVNIAGTRGARTAQSKQRSRNFSVYGEDQLGLNDRWTLVLGAQWATAERDYDDAFLSNGNQSLETGYSRLMPKLGFLWHGGAQWTVFGNVSDSFEPPSFGELTGGPNVDLLDAQTARTVELGTRGALARFEWDVVAYSARVRGELLSLNTPTGQPLGTVNAPRTSHRGIEAGLSVEIAPSLSWRSSYLLSDFRFEDHPTYGDRALPGVPPQFYRGELTWRARSAWAVTLTNEWAPERYAIDMARSWFADPYAAWGLRLGHDAASGLSWFVEGRNLGDRRYAATTGVIADARGQDSAQFLPADGRAVYAGFDWRRR